MADKTAQDWAIELRQSLNFTQPGTTEDVQKALAAIAAPGQEQDLKREVIAILFPSKNRQGFSVSDSVDNYAEF